MKNWLTKLVMNLLKISVIYIVAIRADDDINSNNKKLRKKLLDKYDILALPNTNDKGTTVVGVMLAVRDLWLNDNTQIFSLNAWVLMQWVDHQLKWDYKDFGGLKLAHFGEKEIWKPDIHVYNNAEISEIDHYGDVHMLVSDDGRVVWVPPAQLKVFCPMDLKFWPFDQHTCQVVLGSWTTSGLQVDVQFVHNTTKVVSSYMTPNSNNWEMVKATQERIVTTYPDYNASSEYYMELKYDFTIKRNWPTFSAIAIVPAVVIPLFLMIQFILPADHPQRLPIGYVCSILVLLELLFLKLSLPKLGTSVPLIVSYYSQCFIMVVLTVALSGFLGRLSHPQNPLLAFPPPEIIKKVVTGPLAVILCIQQHANKVGLSSGTSEDAEALEITGNPNYSHEWLLVARTVDRISLIFFVCVFVFSLIAYVSPIK